MDSGINSTANQNLNVVPYRPAELDEQVEPILGAPISPPSPSPSPLSVVDFLTGTVARHRFSSRKNPSSEPALLLSVHSFKTWNQVLSTSSLHLYSKTVKAWAVLEEKMEVMKKSDDKFLKGLDALQEKFRQLIMEIKKTQ